MSRIPHATSRKPRALSRLVPLAGSVALSVSLFATATATATTNGVPSHPLLVCADPNNLPFSNRARQGFENKIIELVASNLGEKVEYVWWAQRRGYARNTLNDSKCDVWPGMATGVEKAATSHPYYRSSYVFVTRAGEPLDHLTLDDPRLKDVRIGVQMIGNDSTNTPPAHALADRGIIENIRGFMVYGDYRQPDPQSPIMAAVENRQIDVAAVWGPVAGYFAHRSPRALRLQAMTPATDPRWPMCFDISMGVRRDDRELLESINQALDRLRPAIAAILARYHVPLENEPAARLSALFTAPLKTGE